MPERTFEPLLAFFVMIFRYEVGTVQFYIMLGSTLVGILVVARHFARLFGSSKGIFSAMIAVAFPLALAAGGYVMVEHYALPKVQVDWAVSYLPWTVFAVVATLVALLASSKIWGIGRGAAVVVLVLAGLGGVAAQYVGELVIDVVDAGYQQIEKRDAGMRRQIEPAN